MEIKKQKTYSKPVDIIFKSYVNEAFVKSKMESLGARNIQVEIKKEASIFKVKIKCEMPADIPGVLKKFAKTWNKVTQIEEWTGNPGGPYTGKMLIKIEAVPIRVHGQMKLTAIADGSLASNSTKIKSNIPIVGKLLEKFGRDASEHALEKEFNYIEENA